MSNDPYKPQPKQDRTNEAFKNIQASEKRTSDAKSARLKDARLKQEAEVKLAQPQPKSNRTAKVK